MCSAFGEGFYRGSGGLKVSRGDNRLLQDRVRVGRVYSYP